MQRIELQVAHTVRLQLVQSAVIGANVRILTGVLGGVADGAAVDAAVGAM